MNPSVHIVVAHYNENTEWCKDIPFPYTIISKAGIQPETPPNRGKEASTYLEYIINNYDKLTDYTIFLHGHRSSYHHAQNMDEKLKEIKFTKPYSDFNDYPPWPLTASAIAYLTPYKDQLAAILGPFNTGDIIYKPCAQFYASAETIRSRPLHVYQQLYTFLMNCPELGEISGRIFEWLWHFILTGNTVYNGD
jgi:hypothetical protein